MQGATTTMSCVCGVATFASTAIAGSLASRFSEINCCANS